jgi:Asp-tRNA(Asn)/Glu-tRNA(Gln) amidotransferase A subunit family amidase
MSFAATRRRRSAGAGWADRGRQVQFDRIAGEVDAVLTLSAPGEAPPGRTQGDNALNRDLTLFHVPCINIPAGLGPNRLPVGLTPTGPRYKDRHLLTVGAALAPVFDLAVAR